MTASATAKSASENISGVLASFHKNHSRLARLFLDYSDDAEVRQAVASGYKGFVPTRIPAPVSWAVFDCPVFADRSDESLRRRKGPAFVEVTRADVLQVIPILGVIPDECSKARDASETGFYSTGDAVRIFWLLSAKPMASLEVLVKRARKIQETLGKDVFVGVYTTAEAAGEKERSVFEEQGLLFAAFPEYHDPCVSESVFAWSDILARSDGAFDSIQWESMYGEHPLSHKILCDRETPEGDAAPEPFPFIDLGGRR